MEKFTLDEAFDRIYEMALEDKLQDDINGLIELEENNSQFIDALSILQESLILEDIKPAKNDENQQGQEKPNKKDDEESDVFGNIMKQYDQLNKHINARASQIAATQVKSSYDPENNMSTYKPVPEYQEVTRIQDMKFPQNIIFFITSLCKWIKNNILNFIDKFSNIVRSLLGMDAGKTRFTANDLKFKLAKSKEIEAKYVVTGNDAYKQVQSFSDRLNGDDGKYYNSPKTNAISLIQVPYDKVNLLEDYNDINVFINNNLNEGYDDDSEPDYGNYKRQKSGYDAKKTQPAIMIDTSRDLFELQQSLEYFYQLFDQAYGSNDEKLFSIDDLEIMLQLFKDTYESLFNRGRTAVEIAGELSFSDGGINADRLKDNLLRTKINTDNLKKAYVVTNQQIQNISKIIMNKNLLGATQMGVQFAFLSASTYDIMIKIINTIDLRLKEAKDMEKKLQKMKKAYENLVNTLESKRAKINSIAGNISIGTIIQRRINELYDGARYMTQTVQLRMSTLALYISELNDTRVVLKNLNAIPESAFKEHKDKINKFKSLWA